MTMTKKHKIIAIVGWLLTIVAAVAITCHYVNRSRTILVCCDAAGNCKEVEKASDCPGDKILGSCGCPSTNPNGGVDCGC